MLGHVRYGTYGKNSIDYVQPMMRQNNWMNRNLILAGNFNMTNTDELFQSLSQVRTAPERTVRYYYYNGKNWTFLRL